MPFAAHRRVLSVPAARQAVLLGLLARFPMFAGGVVLTLHVVQTLHQGYAQAGAVTAAATACVAVSAPWRGRLLDRLGVRRVLLPSIVVTAACWSLAPFSAYPLLVVLAALAGLFVVPTFAILRQALVAAVPEADRRAALSLDSVVVELAFMGGPLLGAWAATRWPTSWVLVAVQLVALTGAVAIGVTNPRLVSAGSRPGHAAPRRREWLTLRFLVVLAVAAASVLLLTGSDISFVATLRGFGAVTSIGPVLALWGLGSAVGGVAYGAVRRSLPAPVLLCGLGLGATLLALAPGVGWLATTALVTGLFCGPTITATIDALTDVVPEGARGEAMGWHESAMTAGSAIGAPLAGVALDHHVPGGGFAVVALVALTVSALAAVAPRRRRVRAQVRAEPAAVGSGAAGVAG